MENKQYFGDFGGEFIAETLKGPIDELAKAYETIVPTKDFQNKFQKAL